MISDLIKKPKISTSFGENKNKSKLNAKKFKLLQKGTLVKGQSALYWLLAAKSHEGKNQRGSSFIFKSKKGLLKNLSVLSRKRTTAIIGERTHSQFSRGLTITMGNISLKLQQSRINEAI